MYFKSGEKMKHPLHQQCYPLFPKYKMGKVQFQLLKLAVVSLRENLTQGLQEKPWI